LSRRGATTLGKRILSDPPLLDRLLWREGLRPQTLISEDRGLLARSFVTMYGLSALAGIILLAVGESTSESDEALAALIAIAAVASLTSLIGYRRLPLPLYGALLALATVMIAVAAATGPDAGEGVYALFCVFVVIQACLFFNLPVAIGFVAFAIASLGAAMVAKDAAFTVNYLVGVGTVMGASGVVIWLLRARMERLASELLIQAHTDPLTAIPNRRGFDERLAVELARAERSGQPISLLICDLDRFKRVNDELGHLEGDAALRRAAEAITASVRAVDAAARLGGEEFGVVLPEADRPQAFAVAERVREGLEGAFSDYAVPLTGSCGVATIDRDGPLAAAHLYGAADEALYVAKRAGRNRSAAAWDAPAGRRFAPAQEPRLSASSTK
jgi:diguanylate cyclase (GGDEF)-like protein